MTIPQSALPLRLDEKRKPLFLCLIFYVFGLASFIAKKLNESVVNDMRVIDRMRTTVHFFRTLCLQYALRAFRRSFAARARALEERQTLKHCRRQEARAVDGTTEVPPCLSHSVGDSGNNGSTDAGTLYKGG